MKRDPIKISTLGSRQREAYHFQKISAVLAERKANNTTLPVMHTRSDSKLTDNNQVTIPDCIRKHLGLKSGDSVAFRLRDGLVFIEKARPVDHFMTRGLGETLGAEWSSAHDEHAYRKL